MALTPSVKVFKSFTFKDGVRTYSNRYHFNGGTPPDATHWHTLFDNIVTAEKAIFANDQTIVEAVGYAAGSDVPVAQKNYTTVGTLAATGHPAPGEVAALVRYSTAARTTKNHPIYLFNYYHHVNTDTAVDFDKLVSNQKSAMATYAANWISGYSDGGTVTAVRSSPNGAAATGSIVEEFLTHRDFPYTTSV
jgi:hypothetical protein